MQITTDRTLNLLELKHRVSATITTLKNTAAMLRLAAINEARAGEAHAATVLLTIAEDLEDTANGHQR